MTWFDKRGKYSDMSSYIFVQYYNCWKLFLLQRSLKFCIFSNTFKNVRNVYQAWHYFLASSLSFYYHIMYLSDSNIKKRLLKHSLRINDMCIFVSTHSFSGVSIGRRLFRAWFVLSLRTVNILNMIYVK